MQLLGNVSNKILLFEKKIIFGSNSKPMVLQVYFAPRLLRVLEICFRGL